MDPLETWLTTRGPAFAALVDTKSEAISEVAEAQFAATFPSLCYDPTRFDAQTFQRTAFQKTPQRFHNLIQTALRFRTLAIVEREYQWAWGILPRFGVTQAHMIMQARIFFDSIRDVLTIDPIDKHGLALLEVAVLRIVERVTAVHPATVAYRANGNRRRAIT
jgi:hypothetical protein